MRGHRRSEPVYGVTVDVIGQTKVTGSHYLTDSLATSVLNRQLEKNLQPGTAKFLSDRLHFSRSEHGSQRPYRRDIPYSDIRRIYTFPGNLDIFMLCVEGDYEGGRIYYSFRCHNHGDISTIKTIIYGDPGRNMSKPQGYGYENGPRAAAASVVYATEPAPQQYAYVAKEYVATPQPAPRTPSPVYMVRERTPSPVYVRRVSAVRAPPTPVQTVVQRPVYVEQPVEPVVIQRTQVEPTYVERVPTVYATRDPSPVMVRRSISRPASVVYVDEPPLQEETGPLILRRVSKIQSG